MNTPVTDVSLSFMIALKRSSGCWQNIENSEYGLIHNLEIKFKTDSISKSATMKFLLLFLY